MCEYYALDHSSDVNIFRSKLFDSGGLRLFLMEMKISDKALID
jgi:hypothetical protein